jgi:hypothetical protein
VYKSRVGRQRDPAYLRDELEATLNARNELGAELEPQLIEGFLARLEKEIDVRVDARLERSERPRDRVSHVPVALGSLGIGIPLTGAAGGTVGFAGVLVVWIGIVCVNFAYALANRR